VFNLLKKRKIEKAMAKLLEEKFRKKVDYEALNISTVNGLASSHLVWFFSNFSCVMLQKEWIVDPALHNLTETARSTGKIGNTDIAIKEKYGVIVFVTKDNNVRCYSSCTEHRYDYDGKTICFLDYVLQELDQFFLRQ